MDEAPVPTGPTRRTVLVQSLESAENGDAEVSALRVGGAALRVTPATEGVHVFRRTSPGQRRFA
eukprot:6320028-Alexandrium_andersonii.AAC.1